METVTAVLGLGALGFVLVTIGMLAALIVGSLAGPTIALAIWLGGRRQRPAYARAGIAHVREEVGR